MEEAIANFKLTMTTFIPITKFLVFVGIIICLVSITVATYSFLKREMTFKETLTYLRFTFVPGLILNLSLVLANFVFRFEIDFSSFKQDIFPAYMVSLFTIVVFRIISNYSEESE